MEDQTDLPETTQEEGNSACEETDPTPVEEQSSQNIDPSSQIQPPSESHLQPAKPPRGIQQATMADSFKYAPRTKVDWRSNQAYSHFRMWKKEVERIINGPMKDTEDAVKLNTVYIWAGANAESLIEARQAEEPTLKVECRKFVENIR